MTADEGGAPSRPRGDGGDRAPEDSALYREAMSHAAAVSSVAARRSKRGRAAAPGATADDEKDDGGAESRGYTDLLEHLLVVGNHRRHEHWRVHEWERRRWARAEARRRPGPKPAPPPPTPHAAVHARSVRLSGGAGGRRAPDPWPRRLPVLADAEGPGAPTPTPPPPPIDDAAWSEELGDGIDPVFFARHRLSADPPAAVAAGGAAVLPPESFTLARAAVPRALLLRCWERAVHAAATTVPSVGPRSAAAAPGNGSDESEAATVRRGDLARNRTEQMTRPAAMEKCRCLGIVPPEHENARGSATPPSTSPRASPLQCQSCGLRFESAGALDDHFFGSVDGRVRGCCWRLVPRRQCRILDQVLQGEVRNQCRNLLSMLLLDSGRFWIRRQRQLQQQQRPPPRGEAPMGGPKLLFNWSDVLDCCASHVSAAATSKSAAFGAEDPNRCLYEADSALQATLLPSHGVPRMPLALNDRILETATRRLVARYGMVPR